MVHRTVWLLKIDPTIVKTAQFDAWRLAGMRMVDTSMSIPAGRRSARRGGQVELVAAPRCGGHSTWKYIQGVTKN